MSVDAFARSGIIYRILWHRARIFFLRNTRLSAHQRAQDLNNHRKQQCALGQLGATTSKQERGMWICSDAPISSAMITVTMAVILLVVTVEKSAPGSKVTPTERTEPNGQRLSAGRDLMTQWERTEPNGRRRTAGILSTAGRSLHRDTGGSVEQCTIKE